jgi:hypothetical protein
MKKQLLFLVIIIILSKNTFAAFDPQTGNPILVNDGPYIFMMHNELRIKWIHDNYVKEKLLTPDNFKKYKKKFRLSFSYDDLKSVYSVKPDYRQCYTMVDSIGMLTDIHGEYRSYISSLKEMGIIDSKLNWKFGSGHLVILGDMFDRGDMVTEILWHLFGLEKQAEKAGGKVDILLGNHEVMVLNNDVRYINEKYQNIEKITGTRYGDLYSDSSVLGRWLRSMPVMITVDNILFVHAGISPEMVQRNLTIEQINSKFSENFTAETAEEVKYNEELDFLDSGMGPVWYRGYFSDTTLHENMIDPILDFYGKEHIVVGHTPHEGITLLFHNKILGTDTGMMYHKPEEMLMYVKGAFYKTYTNGTRIKIK